MEQIHVVRKHAIYIKYNYRLFEIRKIDEVVGYTNSKHKLVTVLENFLLKFALQVPVSSRKTSNLPAAGQTER